MRHLIWLLCFTASAVTGYSLEKIGEVVALDGRLLASDLDGEERLLAKHSDVFLGDTLITEENSKGQVQFTDGTIVLLIPESRYSVNHYNKSYFFGENRFLARLYDGGMRLSTGFIARKSPENFEVNTPNATIGVRGTIFESRMVEGDLYAAGSSGNISLSNGGGSLVIGPDMPYGYAVVSSMGSMPEPLTERPEVLDLSLFEPPAGGIPFGGEAPSGSGALAGRMASSYGFAWGPAVGGLAVIATVAGVVASSASQSPSTFSH